VKTKDPREPDTKPDNIINNKNVNIMNTDNEYGYLELVDTVADAVELGKKLFEALKDGVQLNDAFVLLAEAKNIEEIVQDAPQAFLELKDLDPEEAQAAAALLAERIDAEPGSALDIVEQALNLLTRGVMFTFPTLCASVSNGRKPHKKHISNWNKFSNEGLSVTG
jgi:hypothetical protein